MGEVSRGGVGEVDGRRGAREGQLQLRGGEEERRVEGATGRWWAALVALVLHCARVRSGWRGCGEQMQAQGSGVQGSAGQCRAVGCAGSHSRTIRPSRLSRAEAAPAGRSVAGAHDMDHTCTVQYSTVQYSTACSCISFTSRSGHGQRSAV